ncbi:MAG: anthranilate synthase component I [Eubacteriales bacterium]
MIFPTSEVYENLKNKYTVIPIIKEIEGDVDTPISLFKKLCKDEVSYLLESMEGGSKWGRYSFVGRKPYITIIGSKNSLGIHKGDESTTIPGKYMDEIRKLFKKYTMPDLEMYPDFLGGAVGYIGYDIIRDYEELRDINHDDIEVPDIHLFIMKEIIVYDHMRQKILIIVNQFTEDKAVEQQYSQCMERLTLIEREIRNNTINKTSEIPSEALHFRSNETKKTFIDKVKTAKEHIRRGDIFQVVLSQRLEVETRMNPLEFYRVLRSLNPSPYMYYINCEDYKIVGSSPELLVKLKEGIIETCPIAGTRPRGKDETEDEKLACELLDDEKEKAEHLMLVDLARNDIGKLSQFGTVKLSQFMEIHRYSHVMHLVSNVLGCIDNKYDMFDVLISCLPAGTVSGAPKVRAMEIIDALEISKRGLYAGCIGYFGFNGNMDTCITIRTVLFKNNKAYIQVGAGIVADSQPDNEYDETLRKAEALLDAIRRTGGVGQ